MSQAETVTSTRDNVAELHPDRKTDPTNALRQRRHRAKTRKKKSAVTVKPPVEAQKPNESKPNVTPRSTIRALQRQTIAAVGSGFVGLGLMLLTLKHGTRGTMLITGCEWWEGLAMATGIDCAYVSLKTTLLTASDKVRKQVGTLAETAIVGTLIGSAAMNIAAFTSGASNVYTMAAGALMGACIPALLYVVTQVGAAAWIDCHARA